MKNQIKSDALLNAFEQFQLTEKEMNEVKGGKPDNAYVAAYYKTISGCVGIYYDEFGNTIGYTLDDDDVFASTLINIGDNYNGGNCQP